jgi:hypothetical protein
MKCLKLKGRFNMTELKENQFQCANCKGIFEKAWTDEEAKAELRENFDYISTDECDFVCNDCYEEIMKIKKIER